MKIEDRLSIAELAEIARALYREEPAAGKMEVRGFPERAYLVTITEEDFAFLTIDEIGFEFMDGFVHPGAIFEGGPNYWGRLKDEFRILICTNDPKYKDLRNSFRSKRSQMTVVSAISAAVAEHMGIAVGVLTPFCALCLIALVKMGREAFCKMVPLDVRIPSPDPARQPGVSASRPKR